MAIRYYLSGTTNYNVQSIGGGQTAGYYGQASVTGNTDLSLTISGGKITNTSTNREFTITGNTYVVSDEGNYLMKASDNAAYLLSDSNTLATGMTIISGVWVVMGWDSDEGIDIEPIVYYPADSYTVSNLNVDSEIVSGYDDLAKLTKLTYTVTKNDDPTVTQNVTYSYFIVPAEVTAEKSVHLTDNENAILLVIPALVIIAIIIGVLAVAMRGRE